MFDHIALRRPAPGSPRDTRILAGGAAPGEELQEAVLREGAEETGLLTAAVVYQNAVEDKPHPRDGTPPPHSFFHPRAPADTLNTWQHQIHRDGDDTDLTFTAASCSSPATFLSDTQDTWPDRTVVRDPKNPEHRSLRGTPPPSGTPSGPPS
ncbi:NUDIX domain-containing protein [Streptomyces sp. CA-250714]|uniref:NUDIX domain-containing protein n=1 Tax=Streptomyces sp. CA-250714 TaxID=3240060 RepID=UPI003D947E0A